jgi:hypothetical protein
MILWATVWRSACDGGFGSEDNLVILEDDTHA